MTQPIRVLHAVGGMNRGGTETWLMNTLRRMDRQSFKFTFMKTDPGPHAYDEELHRLGATVVVCQSPRRLHHFAPALADSLRTGRYDIVHSHLHFYSGVVLTAARHFGVKARIAHAHTDTRNAPSDRNLWRRSYATFMRSAIRHSMTHGLAVSEGAAENLFGNDFRSDNRIVQFACGIDLSSFSSRIDRMGVRTKYGIPLHAKVVGHVGRFEAPKNHALLLEVVKALMDLDPDIWLVLAGDGALLRSVRASANNLDIAHRVVFLGSVSNVPEILMGLFDVFLFPSAWEGLGLAVVEAQAAGLNCVVSDAVPSNAIIARKLTRIVPLGAPIPVWAEAVKHAFATPRVHQPEALMPFIGSPFDIDQSSKALYKMYDAAMGSRSL